MHIYSIGYERRDPEALIERLRSARVDTLVDIRLNAWSRRPGYSKSQLAQLLEDVGIEYVHAPALGNAKENRDGFGQLNGKAAKKARATYRAHLDNGSTPAVLELLDEIPDRTIALMCYERDERYCHREVLVEHLQDLEPGLVAIPL